MCRHAWQRRRERFFASWMSSTSPCPMRNTIASNPCPGSADSEFQQFAMNPRRAPARVRLRHRANPPNGRRSTGMVGRPMRRRLFPAHHSRKPRRCQAMTRGAGGGASRTSARDGTRSRGRPRPCRTAPQGRRAWRSGRAGTRARSPCPRSPGPFVGSVDGVTTGEAARFLRIARIVFAAIGFLGFVLAAVGIYSSVSYSVRQQTRDIGIRIALGASRSQVVRVLLRASVKWIAAGLAMGALVGALPSRVIVAQLFAQEIIDPPLLQ
jgi:hypothetical protein